MRTTLDIDIDVLQAAKNVAQSQHTSAGAVLSAWARQALSSIGQQTHGAQSSAIRNGVPRVIFRKDEIITLDHVQALDDSTF